jgi:hypothetical protein
VCYVGTFATHVCNGASAWPGGSLADLALTNPRVCPSKCRVGVWSGPGARCGACPHTEPRISPKPFRRHNGATISRSTPSSLNSVLKCCTSVCLFCEMRSCTSFSRCGVALLFRLLQDTCGHGPTSQKNGVYPVWIVLELNFCATPLVFNTGARLNPCS